MRFNSQIFIETSDQVLSLRDRRPRKFGSAIRVAVMGIVFGAIMLAPLSRSWSQVPQSPPEAPMKDVAPPATPQAERPGSDAQVPLAYEAVELQLPAGTSMIIDLPGELQRASVTNPEMANFQIIPPSQLLLSGKAPGVTTLIVWVDGKRRYYDVVVKLNLFLAEQAIKEISPNDDIIIRAVQNSVTLSGTVSDPSLIARTVDIAKAFLPEKTAVINLLRLGEPHQIMLKVEIAEVNRSALREIGLDFVHIGDSFALAFFGATHGGVLSTIASRGTTTTDQRLGAIVQQGDTTALLRALEQEGILKSLARPTLIAASGTSASFLVGGEFPYPVVQGGTAGSAAAITIQFKPFGVKLDFTPTLNDLGSINLKIAPEVSDLDFSHAVTISGTTIPSLTTRRANTIVDLRPGQSLAIGGLIKSLDRNNLSKFPLLGDIPVLGAIFRSTKFMRDESDLIIFVTPDIAKPFAAGQAPNLDKYMKTTADEAKDMRQFPGR